MAKVEIVFFSAEGHTARQAKAVADGARGHADVRVWSLDADGNIPDMLWETLEKADAIIFGSPTHMGGPAWQFKKFADLSSEVWHQRGWQNKLAGGFTTSASTNGDKNETLNYFITFANQHGMLWVSLGQPAANKQENGPDDMNWTGANGGAMAISPANSDPSEAPRSGDLESARAYGARIAQMASRVEAA
ncbi:flavodoxin family protein [Litoreibacter roseus]|uniref:Tryptophan repressor binding protein n=1 Tax=Litoreibacter roseus TaxID=2601869 RepID=A0A6N6JHE2_9RHOB|nr:flavodoxin family protein [Litoreibacter roseus]GFE65751.1 tryptophan repressor binding protein [Litoreibacter roseus]